MNIQYPVHNHINHFLLVLLALAMVLISVLIVYQENNQLLSVEFAHPENIASNQVIPRPVPVPEPPFIQPVVQQNKMSELLPERNQFHPVLQPIPAPPGQ